MEKKECDFFCDGKCEKHNKHGICSQLEIGDFKDGFYVIDISEVCREASIYGNRFISITEEDIKELINGKVLAFVDEYGMFVAMDKWGREED